MDGQTNFYVFGYVVQQSNVYRPSSEPLKHAT